MRIPWGVTGNDDSSAVDPKGFLPLHIGSNLVQYG